MTLILNIIWFIFGGAVSAFTWLIAGIVCCITIVLIPCAPMCWRFALFTAFPFGREAIDRRLLQGPASALDEAGAVVGNVLWLIFGGWWNALAHVFYGLALCVTLIGIPFGLQMFKLAGLAWWPFGKEIVDSEVARRARTAHLPA
ncbi:MAG: YccF domain-containing protein [Terricaulis sp.]